MAILDIPTPCDKIVDFSDCKKAAASEIFNFDLYAENYLSTSHTVTAVTWATGTLTEDDSGFSGGTFYGRFSGGTLGDSVTLTATVTTSGSETLVFTLTLTIT